LKSINLIWGERGEKVKVKKVLTGLGFAMFIWFTILIYLEYLGLEIVRVGFLSVLGFSFVLLALGKFIPEKKGS